MTIMELGAIGELVGGVAVIASLIFVGLQVRQNTHAISSGRHQEMLHSSGRRTICFQDDPSAASAGPLCESA